MKLSYHKNPFPILVVLLVFVATFASSQFTHIEQGVKTAMAQPNSHPTEFPELVGLPGEEAKASIQEKYPDLKAIVVPEGSMMTMDYRTDRVRIWVDDEGKVKRTPRIG